MGGPLPRNRPRLPWLWYARTTSELLGTARAPEFKEITDDDGLVDGRGAALRCASPPENRHPATSSDEREARTERDMVYPNLSLSLCLSRSFDLSFPSPV